MKLEFREETARENRIRMAEQLLRETHVEVGLPAGAPGRSRWLLALHERGAPGAGIPPRPVVGPALGEEQTRHAMASGLAQACEAAAAGEPAGVPAGFERAGAAGVQAIRDKIDAGLSPGNAPATIAKKGFDKPLVDTGALYASFGYEVKRQ